MNTDKYSYEQKEQHINLLSQYPRFFFFFSCFPCHTPTNISMKQMKNIVKPNAQQSLVFIHEMNSNNSITPIVIPIIPSFFTDSAAKLRITWYKSCYMLEEFFFIEKNHHAFLIRRSDYRQDLTPVSDENIPFFAGIGKILRI